MKDWIAVTKIRLEASSRCQLRCPSCPTTSGAIQPAIGSGVLKFSDFKALLDGNPGLREIELSNYGEIFLNPELIPILEYAWLRKVQIWAANGVNLNHVQPEVLEAVVKYGVRQLRVSLDGASQATYAIYRVRGNFERVIENVRTINAFKAQYGTSYPELLWQFIVFGHNEHELSQARALAAELNMKFKPKLTWDDDFAPLKHPEQVRQELGLSEVTRSEYQAQHGQDYAQRTCHQLWDSPQINYDGRVLGCCRNFWGDFGANALSEGLDAAINSPRMQVARAMLLGRHPAQDHIPCTTCEIYETMKANHRWLVRPTRLQQFQARLSQTYPRLRQVFTRPKTIA